MKTLNIITQILLIVGGLNWALVGLFSFDLVAAIFGEMTILSRIVYILVGISAIYQLVNIKSYADNPKAVNYNTQRGM